MKRFTLLLLVFAMLATMLAACAGSAESQPSTPGSSSGSTNSTTGSQPSAPVDPWAGYETITVAEALELCEQFVNAPSEQWYYIRATVVEVQKADYGQLLIKDETGEIMVYGSYSADGSLKYKEMAEKPVAGDEILIYGCLQNYKGNTKEVQKGYIIDFISNGQGGEAPELPADGTVLTIAQALELAATLSGETAQRYYITATVDSITSAQYGAMRISDGTGTIDVYNSASADGSVGYQDMKDKPYKGDSVKLYCTIQNFNGKFEIKSAWIVEFSHNQVEVDESAYTDMTVAQARDSVKGTLIRVDGVVATITYDGKNNPAGVILVDETGSIYVYDGDLAARVKKGNQVTVLATKDYWILEDEQNNAQKFGYQGCNQLTDVIVKEIDNGIHEFDKSWITSTTVKEMIDTPVDQDISTKIFKVTALVKEVPGQGFTNFYFFDLDGQTGSYAYSQCDGEDFSWVRAFDGKVCTVYLMALNAKSRPAECFWRFLPVAIVDEGFDPSTVNVAENAVKFYGLGQFMPSYSGNPALEVVTSVANELLGYTGATLSYASSNEDIIQFELIDGKLIMNCVGQGTATVTVTGSYNGVEYSESVEITVTINEEISFIDVKTAIDTAVGETVTVKGIVGPSLVNQVGFYLIDETGLIAVRCTADEIATLKIGYEVVLTGTRYTATKGGTNYFGQTCINDATIVANYYGEHDYYTGHFITGKTLADIANLNILEDHTTEAYVVKAKVEFKEDPYYTTLTISYEGTTLQLYMSGAGQYSFLKQFAGQEVTVEVAPCNWNDKSKGYRGCVLAVILEDGTKIVNPFNFQQ